MPRRAAPHRGPEPRDLPAAAGEAPLTSGTAAADDGGPSRPSKSQRKRDAQSVQTLGAELAALPADRLAAIDLPEALRAALDELRRTRSFEGRRRQLQFVGRLMRQADEDALREALAEATIGSARQTLALHEAERWRAELLADDGAATRWLDAHPATDAQRLRSLVRAARRDAEGLSPQHRQPRSHRELFQFIRPLLADASPGAAAQAPTARGPTETDR